MKPAIIDIGEPVFVPCTDCGGRGFVGQSIYTEYCGCSQGEMVLDMTDLATLAQNLSIAAGLCRAFELGGAYHVEKMIPTTIEHVWGWG